MALDKLNFWADYYAAGRELSKRDRMELWDAILAYAFAGEAPKLKGAPSAVFIALKARIDGSIQGAENVKKRKGMASPKPTPSEAPSEGASEAPCEAPSDGQPRKSGPGIGGVQEYKSTGVQEGRGVVPTPLGAHPAQGASPYDPQEAPPTLDAVRAYFAGNPIKGDPEAFFAQYDATGWVDGKGQAIRNWHSQALKWHKMQVRMDAESSARGEPTADQAVWKPAETPEQELARLDEEARRKGWD